MFTGLIRDLGIVASTRKTVYDALITIKTKKLPADTLALGASICCNGVCVTVSSRDKKQFTVLASGETISKTTLGDWDKGTLVNLEPSLRMGDELDGHLVFGHVDGVAECVSIKEEGESKRFSFRAPDGLMPYIASKGSVAIDGVSLTVNEVEKNVFGVNIIPHTLQHTRFGHLAKGKKVNIEIDMLARYVARRLEYGEKKKA
ncbi:MAG: riboflavin synthase [Proteobacteria bacterium]|nr:riboflavin synthase [Pseudomonadota bacterium]